MDSLHAIGFYVSAGISVAGALGVALLQSRASRGASMLVVGLGLTGTYLALSAGLAAAFALLCYAGAAVVVASASYRSINTVITPTWRQLGAVGAAGLLVLIAYAALSVTVIVAPKSGGLFEGVCQATVKVAPHAAPVSAGAGSTVRLRYGIANPPAAFSTVRIFI